MIVLPHLLSLFTQSFYCTCTEQLYHNYYVCNLFIDSNTYNKSLTMSCSEGGVQLQFLACYNSFLVQWFAAHLEHCLKKERAKH